MSSEEESGCLGTDDTFSGTLPSSDSQKLSSSNSNSISNSRSTDSQNGMPYENTANIYMAPQTLVAVAQSVAASQAANLSNQNGSSNLN